MPMLSPGMPPSTDLWIGYSGGLDSTVLLHRLKSEPALAACTLRAVHIHHGLQADADAWSAHCQAICARWQIPLQVLRVDIAQRTRNLEQQARDARYAAFAEVLPADATLALAHHADDVAETLLLRLMRGSGTGALANMRAVSRRNGHWIWRPLLGTPRGELLAYARQRQLSWIEDASNADSCHDRNFIRHEILPRLETRFPNVRSRLRHSADLLNGDDALLQPLIAGQFGNCRTDRGLSLETLTALPIALQAHVVRHWLAETGHDPPGHAALSEFLRQLGRHADDGLTRFDGRHYSLRHWNGTVYLLGPEPQHADSGCAQQWDGHELLVLPRGGSLAWQGPAPFPVMVTYRQGGERIRLPGRNFRHSVKKLLSECVPPWQREVLPFVYNEQGELLAVGDVLVSDTLTRLTDTALNWHPPSEHIA